MSAVEVETWTLVCELCGSEVREEPLCFSCECGPAFALSVVSREPQLLVAYVVPQLPED